MLQLHGDLWRSLPRLREPAFPYLFRGVLRLNAQDAFLRKLLQCHSTCLDPSSWTRLPALGFFKYHSKTLEALLLFNLKRENSSDNKASRIDKQFQSNKSFVEKVLIGEKAILKEYDLLKTKCERKRFSGFGGGYGSILGSFSGQNDQESLQPRQGGLQRKSKAARGR